MAELSALISRLEVATSKLEALGGCKGGAAAPTAAAAPVDDGTTAPFVEAFDELISEYVDKYVSLSKEIGGPVADHAAMVKDVFTAQRAYLVMASKSKAPSDSDLPNLLKAQSEAITKVCDFKSSCKDRAVGNHLSAIAEAIGAMGWVAVKPKPAPFLKQTSEPGAFYGNRVIKEFKDKDDKHVAWARAVAAIWGPMFTYVKTHHTTGVAWNPNGGDAKACAGAGAPPPPAGGPPPPPAGGPPPPPAVTASSGGGGGGRADLFAALQKGGDITKGLKKVDRSQMTHKNPELRGSSVVPSDFKSKAAAKKPAAAKATGKVYPPSYEHLAGKKHNFEYYKDDKNMTVTSPTASENIILYKCEGCVIKVDGKCNNIILNNCKKTAVIFDTVIACVEVNNSQSCQVQMLGKAPMITIDKVDGCQVFLSKDSLDTEIVTAKTSELNINVPGEEEDSDPIEHALPEQYHSIYDKEQKKFITSCVFHA